jgi:hypothetical protein
MFIRLFAILLIQTCLSAGLTQAGTLLPVREQLSPKCEILLGSEAPRMGNNSLLNAAALLIDGLNFTDTKKMVELLPGVPAAALAALNLTNVNPSHDFPLRLQTHWLQPEALAEVRLFAQRMGHPTFIYRFQAQPAYLWLYHGYEKNLSSIDQAPDYHASYGLLQTEPDSQTRKYLTVSRLSADRIAIELGVDMTCATPLSRPSKDTIKERIITDQGKICRFPVLQYVGKIFGPLDVANGER